MKPNNEAYLNERVAAVETALSALFSETECADGVRLNESMRYSLTSGGKRLRPVLLLTFAEMSGVSMADAMDDACAIELIHTYSLIHDDLPCMDNGDFRRGKPASHRVFGEAGAVLAGDALLNAAFERMLSDSPSPIPAENRLAAARELAASAGRLGMIAGQCIDLANETGGHTPNLAELKQLCLLKTSAIIRGACLAGLRLGGVNDPERLAAAETYANALGLAFQIRDDVLDVSGDAATLGKETGRDAGNGKITFVTLLGMDGCAAEIRRLTDQAVAALQTLGGNDFLQELAESLVSRTK